jgi:hypothetical protein
MITRYVLTDIPLPSYILATPSSAPVHRHQFPRALLRVVVSGARTGSLGLTGAAVAFVLLRSGGGLVCTCIHPSVWGGVGHLHPSCASCDARSHARQHASVLPGEGLDGCAAVSHFLAFLACIGSPCLRRCVHGASIGSPARRSCWRRRRSGCRRWRAQKKTRPAWRKRGEERKGGGLSRSCSRIRCERLARRWKFTHESTHHVSNIWIFGGVPPAQQHPSQSLQGSHRHYSISWVVAAGHLTHLSLIHKYAATSSSVTKMATGRV